MIVDGEKLPLLDKKTWALYKELFHSGPLLREDVKNRLDIDEKTLAKVLRQMRNAGLIKTPRMKPITIDLSPSSLEILFPRLMNV
jgi:Mn-dependent DtxR family transcriptional regulator